MAQQETRIIKLPDVIKKTGLSRSQIYHLVSIGKFPKQIKLSERSCGWIEAEVNDWLSDRIAERDCA